MKRYQSWEFVSWYCPERYASAWERHTHTLPLPVPEKAKGHEQTTRAGPGDGSPGSSQAGEGDIFGRRPEETWDFEVLVTWCVLQERENAFLFVFPALSGCINWLYQVVMNVWFPFDFSKIRRSQCSSGCWLLTAMIQNSKKHSIW